MTASMPLVQIVQRYWIWVLIVCELVLVGLGVLFFVLPEYERLSQYSSTQLATRDEDVRTVTHEIAQLKAVVAQYATLPPARIALIESLLPKESAFSNLLFLIARSAERSGFSLDSFSLQEVPPVKGGDRADQRSALVQVSLVGKGYTQWKQFMLLMEQQLPLLDLVAAGFRPQNTRQQFTFRTYSLP